MIGLDQAAVNERARLAPDREGGVNDLLQAFQHPAQTQQPAQPLTQQPAQPLTQQPAQTLTQRPARPPTPQSLKHP